MLTPAPRTLRGRATRDRIVGAATVLIGTMGVRATALEDVCAEARVSKSQLYHYFSNKEGLARAVVARQTERVLAAQMPPLEHLDSWQGIMEWFERLVALQERRKGIGGCPIGSLASELADHDEAARSDLVTSFDRWQGYLVRGLEQMQQRGELAAEADPQTLALATMASIQGGLVLTRTQRSTRPLRVALDAALAYLRLFDRPEPAKTAGAPTVSHTG
jgi:TetR/AcrR family transcriptional regulator, transcriptional repressor for nem operon